ncbi:MAG: D-glycero-beta-D-manno-heptose 1-phosphate adenylyltransferase [Candidatus Omnitrophica bacterium]|nr:D-glycero-beta-D-manno-heptose 1-phosphate adenylyltransferase [Candidatus Omnitrophota bacterium]
MPDKKIKKIAELKEIVENLKREGGKIVFTNGCFDLLHIGHINYLKKAQKQGDILIIGLNSDSSVKKIKEKGRPIIPQSERARILAALEFVDFVTIFEEQIPLNLIKKIKPNVLVKGGDWKRKEVVGSDFVKSYGGKTLVVPFTKGKSTSLIIERIRRCKK